MKIFVDSLSAGYASTIASAFEFMGNSARIKSSDRIAIKPNLTFPVFRRGVMTNPECIEALIAYFKNFTDHITICESDSGGYNRFSMDEVFANIGMNEIAQRYGVKVVNMSTVPSRPIRFHHVFRNLSVPLPSFLLDETDLFVTVPVPKVHSNTGISVSLKNQWGIIQQPDLRLKLHPYFNEVIYQVNKALPQSISVVDGRYGLTRSGPMRGDVLDLEWMLVGDDFFGVDQVVCRMMGFDPATIPHLRHVARRDGWLDLQRVKFNKDFRLFVNHGFYLEREWTDYPGLLTFNSRTLAYVGYESLLARPLHWLLYRFREPFY